MNELGHSLQAMGVVQYLFAVAFLISYVFALGGFLGPRSRTKVWLACLASAIGFAASADPWVNGVLLTLFAVAGIGLFIGVAWLLKAAFATRYSEAHFTRDDSTVLSGQFEPDELIANDLVPSYQAVYRVADEHAAVEYARG
jgi:hypothetical protein